MRNWRALVETYHSVEAGRTVLCKAQGDHHETDVTVKCEDTKTLYLRKGAGGRRWGYGQTDTV